LIEVAGYVGENPVILELSRGCHFLELSRQLTRLPRLRNKTVAHYDHKVKFSWEQILSPKPIGGPRT
jgi:hypothetical protein